jgi:hypothetical protein
MGLEQGVAMLVYATSQGLTRIASAKNSEVFMNCSIVARPRGIKLISLLCVLLLLLALAFLGCQRASVNRPNGIPEALLVVSGASDVQFSSPYGTQQVHYQVKTCYPGKKVIDELSKGMLQKKWVLLNEDFMNPGLKSNSAREEWSTFWDAQGNYIYQWIEDWKDTAGNITRYGLKYVAKDKENPIKNCNMEVYGTFFSKKALDETMPHLPSSGK